MNKLHFILFFTLILTSSSCGSKKKETEVPIKVKESLLKHFPDAKEITWDKETAFEWEADFRMYENKYSANFDSDGNMLIMEYDIEVSNLPSAVVRDIDSIFSGYKIKKAEHCEKGTQQFYEIELEKSEKTLEVVYDEKGNMLDNEDRNKELNDQSSD